MKGTWIRRPTGETTVIFVHGVLSDGETWRGENGTYWPELLKQDERARPVGIYVFEYQTSFFSGTYRLGDVVDALHNHLRLDGALTSKRIVFVCHSMGGIVARRFVVRHQADLIAAAKEIGLFLIASPSLGSEYATWLAPLARFFKHTQADALRFSQANSWLMDLDRDFLDLKEQKRLPIYGKELVEDKFIVRQLFLFKQVVPPFSGARYFGNAYKVPNSTHFTIAKVSGKDSIQHRLLVEFLSEIDTTVARRLNHDTCSGPIAIGFPDSLRADLVKCQLATKTERGRLPEVQVQWPDRTQRYVSLTKTLLDEASKYLEPGSAFYGQPAASVADFINRARYALESSDRIISWTQKRAGLLISGMLDYWTPALDNIIARTLVNFLTLCNVELLYENVALLRKGHLYEKHFPPDLEDWFSVGLHKNIYRQVFDIEQPLASAKVDTLSGKHVVAYFWGPRSEVVEVSQVAPRRRYQRDLVRQVPDPAKRVSAHSSGIGRSVPIR